VKRRDPAAAELLKRILEEARADIVGGEYDEVASTLLPLESHLWQFSRGGRSYQEAFGRVPHIFGRRRFGFARHVLQLLNRFECQYMTHFSFDDGVVPARSDTKVRWEAPDSTTIESLTRIPFAADSPAEYLRLPSRLARSMSGDFVATLVMVHWPMPELPWYGELFRIARYSDVFARFSTLSNYFQTTDPPSFSSSLSSDDYVSPYLANAHRRGDRRPISSVAEQHRRRARFDAIRWLRAVDLAVRRRATEVAAEFDSLETDVETGSATLNERLDESLTSAARPLAELICPPRADGYAGWLIFNPLSFDRQVIVPTDVHTVDAGTPPADATESASPDAASDAPVSAALPAMGFVWLPRGVTSTGTASQAAAVVVEGSMIRNEFLELELDDVTGGIRSLRSPGGRIPLVGQQLVLCGVRSASDSQTESGRTPDGEPAVAEPEPIKSEMRATATSVRLVGPDVAEVVVDGDLRAVPCPAWSDGPRLARFRQTYRLGRGQPVVRVAVEIFDLSKGVFDERADPWQAYLASRFAWLDPRSLMLRGIGTLADLTNARRPESPYFIELHGSRHRTTIVTGGLAFHQRHGDRMLDTLLVTATEECRRFEFGLGVDLPNSFQAALDLIAPPVMIATDAASRGEPEPGVRSGWFFHVDARNVVVTSVTPLGAERPGVRLRAFETAGRYTRAKLRCVHNVTEARMTNFRGQRLATLDHTGDTVPLDLAPHEITQIELEF
jgi:alpha-mannosidase